MGVLRMAPSAPAWTYRMRDGSTAVGVRSIDKVIYEPCAASQFLIHQDVLHHNERGHCLTQE